MKDKLNKIEQAKKLAADTQRWSDLHTSSSKPKYNPINTAKSRQKLESELVRILYYMAVGYDGPHPWGSSARPPFPEFSPLSVKDPKAEKHLRETIEKFMADPQWGQFCNKLLRELNRKINNA